MNGRAVARLVALVCFLSLAVYPWFILFNLVPVSIQPVVTWLVLGAVGSFLNASWQPARTEQQK